MFVGGKAVSRSSFGGEGGGHSRTKAGGLANRNAGFIQQPGGAGNPKAEGGAKFFRGRRRILTTDYTDSP